MNPRSIVFLDRDGTLIETDVISGVPTARNRVESAVLLPGVIDGCRRLHDAGFLLMMITNQPEIARGSVTLKEVEDVNAFVCKALDINVALVCPHDDRHRCRCRKPLPGLLTQGAELVSCVLDERCVMIGDRWRDVEAGRSAGVSTVLIGEGYGEHESCKPDAVAKSFLSAVDWVIARKAATK